MFTFLLLIFMLTQSTLAVAIQIDVPNVDTKERTAPPLDPKYGPFTMTIPLDHFGNETSKTFKNRYWVNADHYAENGPIIMVNNGESTVTPQGPLGYLFNTVMAQLTKDLNGIMVYMEHRFYGSSGPEVDSFYDNTKEDVSTFTSEQALADMAYLVQHLKIKDVTFPAVPKTKVIVYGCSYSGALAAWAKSMYPELFFAAVASSAPIQAQVDFYQYFDPIIQYNTKSCINSFQNAIGYVDKILFGNSTKAIVDLKAIFGSENLLDDTFASIVSANIGQYWQYGVNATSNQFASVYCKLFSDTEDPRSPKTILKNVLSYAKFVNAYSKAVYCAEKEDVQLSSCLTEDTVNGQINSTADSIAWVWQTCNEFGYLQYAPPEGRPTIISRKLDLNYSLRLCQQSYAKFDVPSTPPARKINSQRHGWDLEMEKTIWIDGAWDSWRFLSKNGPDASKALGNDSISIVLPHETHCSNYAAITEKSSQSLVDAYKQQYETLKSWLRVSL